MAEEDIDIYGEDDGFTVAMGPEEVCANMTALASLFLTISAREAMASLNADKTSQYHLRNLRMKLLLA